MPAILVLIVAIVIISAVVGVIAQFLNKLNEANQPPPRRAAGAAPVRQTDRDMDRFLAEIDRLRRKNAGEAGADRPAAAEKPPERPADRPRQRVVAEAVERRDGDRQQRERDREQRERDREQEREARRGRRERDREAAEAKGFTTEPERREKTDSQGFVTQPERRERTDSQGFVIPPSAAPSPILPQATPAASAPPKGDALPVATVVTPSASTGAPATRVTKIAERPRPTPKTDLAKNLTGLLNSGQGVAMAIILQEILGPPRCKKSGR